MVAMYLDAQDWDPRKREGALRASMQKLQLDLCGCYVLAGREEIVAYIVVISVITK